MRGASPEEVVRMSAIREAIWEAMVRDNPNLDGVLKTALDQVMPVVEGALAKAWEKGWQQGYDDYRRGLIAPITNPYAMSGDTL